MQPQFEKRRCRPRNLVDNLGREMPGVWKLIDSLRSARGHGAMPSWPDWCFMPLHGPTIALVEHHMGGRASDRAAVLDQAARLSTLAAWRLTQGVYRFDPAVYEAVATTPVVGDIPHDVLLRMPEWCIYIETPGMELDSYPVHGVFARLDYRLKTGGRSLDVLFDTELDLVPMLVELGPWTLRESIDRVLTKASAAGEARGLAPLEAPNGESPMSALLRMLEPVISLLLFICSQAQEIGDGTRRPANPQPKRVRGEWRLFPADRPTTWDVGMRLGAALRRAYQVEEIGPGGTHAGPRPHIRRAHWHTFWLGPRDGDRRADLRWLPPIPVNVDDVGQLPAVVRKVR